jgi:GNAT superfamily N-acetyltransferase
MTGEQPEVRRIRSDEADLLRRMRLAALADAPEAFGSDHETEQQFRPSTWIRRSVDGAESDHLAMFVATVTGEACGISLGRLLADAPGVVELNSMWVAPPQRGTGIAVALVDAVVEWARTIDAVTVELWVVRENERAAAFYSHYGFVEVIGFPSPPDDPCALERRLRLDLA